MSHRHAHRVAAVLAAALLVPPLAAAGCRGSQRRPAPPRPDRDPLALLGGDAPEPTPRDLLAAYPLGEAPERTDLVGSTAEESLFLVQSRIGLAALSRPTRTERILVVSGSGTMFVGERSYPAVAGASFRIERGTSRRLVADADAPVALLVVLEPGTDAFAADARTPAP